MAVIEWFSPLPPPCMVQNPRPIPRNRSVDIQLLRMPQPSVLANICANITIYIIFKAPAFASSLFMVQDNDQKWLFISLLIKSDEEMKITMFGDGSSIRDYTFIGDIVQGIVAAVHKPLDNL